MFRRDYPRGFVNWLCFWWFPSLYALPVTPALVVALGPACDRRPVLPLGRPSRPLPRRLPALLAAIVLTRLPRTKALLAPFEQTPSHSRPPRTFPSPRRLPLPRTCMILGRAHGR